MTDVILSSFISLFALFGKVEQVDEERAKEMLVSYLRRQFGIRNIDLYLDLYSDMRMAYEMTDDLNTQDTVRSICSNLQTRKSPVAATSFGILCRRRRIYRCHVPHDG